MKEFLECGKIVSTHGVRGEVKAEVWMDSPEEMTALKTLYLDGGKTPLTVKGARVHKNMVLLTLAGVETPEAGSALRQKVLFARREDIPLEKGQYFLQDLLGCEVKDADTGKEYGKLCDITETGANRVYHIRFADGKVRLAPDIPQVVLRLAPEEGACYDAMISIDLSRLEPMAALPFHPSEAVTLRELLHDPGDYLRQVEQRAAEQFGGKATLSLTDQLVDGKLVVQQGIIAGCAGGMYDNIAEAAAILSGGDVGCGPFSLSVYPPSIPVNLELMQNGVQQALLEAGGLFKPCFCGPCFGAGDVPANNALSVRHTTRNFPNREGSKPGDGQLSGVLLMDARSIAATARNHGVVTSAADMDYPAPAPVRRTFDGGVYGRRVYFGYGKARPEAPLHYGPNIAEWPAIPLLGEELLLQVASVLRDPVTTTDELIPSGETSSYRSNPLKLASFALSRRDPDYVPRALDTQALETARQAGSLPAQVQEALEKLGQGSLAPAAFQIGSVIFANKPGDGSAREQAASCQRVLGGCANLCYEFATKRYRSNCVNWGMLPFTLAEGTDFPGRPGDFLYVPQVREKVTRGDEEFPALLLTDSGIHALTLYLKNTTAEERELLLTGCLMNHYAAQNAAENRR